MNKKFTILPSLALLVALSACGAKDNTDQAIQGGDVEKNNEVTEPQNGMKSEAFTVLVDLKDAGGKTTGTAELEETEEGVKVRIKAEGLPEGKHGLHFHETGVCEAPNFESAGGHFNPDDTKHGLEMEGGPHAGDLPNLEVGEDGTVEDEFTAKNVTLEMDAPNSLLKDSGTALVIHSGKDDGKTQPSGDSGERIACGVIK
ncbi:superoxide dismutase family protein [Sporosarcina sp. BI001-red]|uniref:superoxide dismutase family protein n=1 Tax=Sporosarcina sp. BI001-red TaxID=2282866 RepID=UPI000E28677E|nr:superoxide dismutase family protein [Sporosarcina sp. BI001-red]REB10146.1 superoxide dismutase family protein [Sporosarcina sp. BI001-red]